MARLRSSSLTCRSGRWWGNWGWRNRASSASARRGRLPGHHVHNDAFLWPGLQDLTASVDFTALAEAGTQAGFELEGYCTQAGFLLGNGLPKLLEEAETRADETRMQRLRNEAKQLTLPSGMGERFQAMGFSRDVELGAAFLTGDLMWRL